jgi:hypothetical protein
MSIALLRLTTRRAVVQRSPAARPVYRSSLILRTAKRVSSLSGQGCSGASPYQSSGPAESFVPQDESLR